MAEATASQLASAAGWSCSPEGVFSPVAAPEEAMRSKGLGQLQQLTDFVAHLEYEVG